jgi:hypothetical protein
LLSKKMSNLACSRGLEKGFYIPKGAHNKRDDV